MVLYLPAFAAKFNTTGFAFGYSILQTKGNPQALQNLFVNLQQALWNQNSGNPETSEAMTVLKKYAANETRVMALFDTSVTTEAMVLSHKGEILPLADPLEDEISPQVTSMILNYPDGLGVGDLIFMAMPSQLGAAGDSVNLQLKIARNLCQRFDFEQVDIDGGVIVFRLEPIGSIEDHTYCDLIQQFNQTN